MHYLSETFRQNSDRWWHFASLGLPWEPLFPSSVFKGTLTGPAFSSGGIVASRAMAWYIKSQIAHEHQSKQLVVKRYLLLGSDIIHAQLCPWWIRIRPGLKRETNTLSVLGRRRGRQRLGREDPLLGSRGYRQKGGQMTTGQIPLSLELFLLF